MSKLINKIKLAVEDFKLLYKVEWFFKKKLLTIIEENEYKNYENLASVKKCKNELLKAIEEEEFEWINKAIYEMLTIKPEFIKEDYKEWPESKIYSGLIEDLENELRNFPTYTHYTWHSCFYINLNPKYKKEDSQNYEILSSVGCNSYTFIDYIPELLEKLVPLCINSDTQNSIDMIEIKIPKNHQLFSKLNDSLVIHFKNKDNAEKIQEIYNNWLSDKHIVQCYREFNRTQLAKDFNWEEFTKSISKQIQHWIIENRWFYNKENLSKEAINKAILSSQKSKI